ncbi:hypothetical protein [Aquamicrobium segne]
MARQDLKRTTMAIFSFVKADPGLASKAKAIVVNRGDGHAKA